MTFKPSTGVVSWTSGEITTSCTITIRATNPAGQDTESWVLTVLGAPDIVPDGRLISGTPVTASHAGGSVTLEWGGSCNPSVTDYAVHEGLVDLARAETLLDVGRDDGHLHAWFGEPVQPRRAARFGHGRGHRVRFLGSDPTAFVVTLCGDGRQPRVPLSRSAGARR